MIARHDSLTKDNNHGLLKIITMQFKTIDGPVSLVTEHTRILVQ